MPAGKYLVEVSDRSVGVIEQFLTFSASLDPTFVYYPNSPTPVGARPLAVAVGENLSSIDFVVPDPAQPVYSVAGRVENLPFDTSGQRVRLVSLESSDGLPPQLEIGTTLMAADGSFLFQYVPPGRYEVRGLIVPGLVSPPTPVGALMPGSPPQTAVEESSSPRTLWFRQEVVMRNASLAGVFVTAQEGRRVRGRIEVSPELNGVDLGQVSMASRSLGGWNLEGLPLGRIERDGRFSSVALPPGRYLVTPRSSGTSFVEESITRGGKELLGEGIEIGSSDVDDVVVTLTSLRATVVGTVRDGTGKVRPDARVVFFRDAGAWQEGLVTPAESRDVGTIRTDRFGNYELLLAPGAYYVVAIAEGLPNAWRNPELLKSLIPISTKLSSRRGARTTADLTVKSVTR